MRQAGVIRRLVTFVQKPLVWLGMADPAASMATSAAYDPEASSITKTLAGWHEAVGDKIVTCGELKDLAYQRPQLREALADVAADRHGMIDAKLLGKWAQRFNGRVVAGFKLTRAGMDGNSKVALWRVLGKETP